MYFYMMGLYEFGELYSHVIFVVAEMLIQLSFLVCLFRLVFTIYRVLGWDAR